MIEDYAESAKGKKPSEDDMAEMRERFRACVDADDGQRQKSADDKKFAFKPGEQWDKWLLTQRGDRPHYEFNRSRMAVRQITGNQRQNRPGIKVRPANKLSKGVSDVLQGLIRNIQVVSSADNAYDTGYEDAVAGGYGVWKIATRYSDDTSFDQDIWIEEVRNPYAVWFGPASDYSKRDARFAFELESMSRDDYAERWPDAALVSFEDAPGNAQEWWSDKEVRIARYWCKHRETKTIYLLSNGETVDSDKFDDIADQLANPPVDPATGQPAFAPITIAKDARGKDRKREVVTDRIEVSIVSGSEVLDGPYIWAGKYIPLIPVWGDLVNYEGKDEYSGLIRHIKDAQRVHNFTQSSAIEIVSNAPKSPYLATPEMVKGFEPQWERSGTENVPVLLYNKAADGSKPSRDPAPDVPVAMLQLGVMAADELKKVSGIDDAQLGYKSNEISGSAIQKKVAQGETANYNYIDNLTRALKYTGEQLVDLIPKIYDTEREVAILGADGKQSHAVLNQSSTDENGKEVILNDLSQAKFHVVIDTGPSFQTQRMETADAMASLAKIPGPIGQLSSLGWISNMDVPGLDEYEKSLRAYLIGQKVLLPGPDDQPAQPQQPNPVMLSKLRVDDAQASLSHAKGVLTLAQADDALADAQLKRAQAGASLMQAHAEAEQAAADAFHALPGNRPEDKAAMQSAMAAPDPSQPDPNQQPA